MEGGWKTPPPPPPSATTRQKSPVLIGLSITIEQKPATFASNHSRMEIGISGRFEIIATTVENMGELHILYTIYSVRFHPTFP